MLSYQHQYHAGNFADVHKHLILRVLFESLLKKEKPFSYIDCHAGSGIYDLESKEARKTAERSNGIDQIWREESNNETVQTYLESIRSFDAESQRSLEKLNEVNLLPAQEFPLDESGIRDFRQNFRERFEIDPNTCPVYTDISEGHSSPGVEYYLPLFFEQTESLLDYLPSKPLVVIQQGVETAAADFWSSTTERCRRRWG